MKSVAEMESTLHDVFNPEQSRRIAQLVYDSYADLAKTSDLRDLRDVVRELADAQKQTDVHLRELADAQKQTDMHLQELADAQKQTDMHLQELADAQKQTEKELRNLARQVGGLSESFGGSLEDFAIDLVPDLLEHYWGMHVEAAGRDSMRVNESEYEFDLVIRGTLNGKPLTVLGEAKSNLSIIEAKRFLQIARKAGDCVDHDVRIIFFGYRVEKAAREWLKEQGAYMVFSHGKVV
jgi:rubrerythrin